jgi:DNA processing protein
MNKEHIYFNAFNQVGQIGSVRFRKLLNHFPDMETAWRAPMGEYLRAGLEEPIVQKILEIKTQIEPEAEFEKLLKKAVTLLTYPEESYPKLLKEIPNPPMILYILGTIQAKDEMAVAVVGSRKFSQYGQQVTQDIVRDLVRANITVVSGLALGIDALAHRTAVEFDGRTVAVLACGIDSIYPANNRVIADKILQGHGAIISEFPLGTPPLKHHFPHRNRIISGLSLGTVVIEAALDSGALITAQHALEQNRQVFAVPGSIYNPASAGPNNLLKMGAKPVTAATDILEDLNLGHLQQELLTEEIVGDNEDEQKILAILTRVPQHFDQITQLVSLPAATVAASLTIMEMKGKVRNLGANQYIKPR